MRRVLVPLGAAALLVATACGTDPTGTPQADDPAAPEPAPAHSAPEIPGMAVYESTVDVAETSSRVQDALQEAGMVVAVVDHAENAADVGEELRPTTLVIGGAPPAGTPVMQEDQRAGIDLPQKFLAWEAQDGTVYLGHNSAEHVAAGAGIDPDSPALEMLRTASADLAVAASGSQTPVSDGTRVGGGEDDLVEQDGDGTVEESIARYTRAFDEQDLMTVATVDHAMGASSIDEELRPTQVIFAANPQVGTTLLQASQTMGIDLPLRYLAYEDEDGAVRVGHPDIRALADRHGVTESEDTLEMVETATDMFTTTAAGG